ncbi:MAG: LptA/OstA family protein [Verrucomicrobiales bacterium]
MNPPSAAPSPARPGNSQVVAVPQPEAPEGDSTGEKVSSFFKGLADRVLPKLPEPKPAKVEREVAAHQVKPEAAPASAKATVATKAVTPEPKSTAATQKSDAAKVAAARAPEMSKAGSVPPLSALLAKAEASAKLREKEADAAERIDLDEEIVPLAEDLPKAAPDAVPSKPEPEVVAMREEPRDTPAEAAPPKKADTPKPEAPPESAPQTASASKPMPDPLSDDLPKEEMNITANSQTDFDLNTKTVVFTGDVEVSTDRFRMTTEKLVVHMRDDQQGMEYAEAFGDVRIQMNADGATPGYRGTSKEATYRPDSGLLTLTGWPEITQAGKKHIATTAETKMMLYTDGRMKTSGRNRTVFAAAEDKDL